MISARKRHQRQMRQGGGAWTYDNLLDGLAPEHRPVFLVAALKPHLARRAHQRVNHIVDNVPGGRESTVSGVARRGDGADSTVGRAAVNRPLVRADPKVVVPCLNRGNLRRAGMKGE